MTLLQLFLVEILRGGVRAQLSSYTTLCLFSAKNFAGFLSEIRASQIPVHCHFRMSSVTSFIRSRLKLIYVLLDVYCHHFILLLFLIMYFIWQQTTSLLWLILFNQNYILQYHRPHIPLVLFLTLNFGN